MEEYLVHLFPVLDIISRIQEEQENTTTGNLSKFRIGVRDKLKQGIGEIVLTDSLRCSVSLHYFVWPRDRLSSHSPPSFFRWGEFYHLGVAASGNPPVSFC